MNYFLSHYLIIPKRPMCLLGSMIWWQRGHLTGADEDVAFNSMSGAVNVVPQSGQVMVIVPLSIVRVIIMLSISYPLFNEDNSGGN